MTQDEYNALFNEYTALSNLDNPPEEAGRGTLAMWRQQQANLINQYGSEEAARARLAQIQSDPTIMSQIQNTFAQQQTTGGLGGGGFFGGLVQSLAPERAVALEAGRVAGTVGLGALGLGALEGAGAGLGAGEAAGLGEAAAMTPEAYTAATGAGLGTTGTAASAGLGTAATPATGALANYGYQQSLSEAAPAGGWSSADSALALTGANTVAGQTTPTTTTTTPNTLASMLQSPGGAATISGLAGLYAGERQADAAEAAAREQARQFDISRTEMRPWLEAGGEALAEQRRLLGLGGENRLAALMTQPGYQFGLSEGRRAREAAYGGRGMGSGKAMRAMEQFGQDYATGQYGEAVNRLAALSGTGQTQSERLSSLGQNYAAGQGTAGMTAANARMSGLTGAAGALSGYLYGGQRDQNTNQNTNWWTNR